MDINDTVFAMRREKAPGPDGFLVEFSTSSCEVVGDDFIKVVHKFFLSGVSLKKTNTTAISLIRKVTSAEKLADFRPISCSNSYYKVISRILAIRLKFLYLKRCNGIN